MNFSRRDFLQSSCAGFAACALPQAALALDYPVRPVHIFEGFGGGGAPDIVSRLTAQWLSAHLGAPFVVENRTGAAGNLAAEAVASAPADGYTLLTCLSANAINATLYRHLGFDFLRDFTPVAGLVRLPLVLLVNPSFPAQTLPEFIAYARDNPGKVDIASPGIGTPMHVTGELLKMTAGIDTVHVPYRGPAGAFTDLLAGRVQAFIITVPAAFGFLKTGKLRALAVTGAMRSDVLPRVPTVSETLPGFEATAWDGICAPKGTPEAIVERLNSSIDAALADPIFVAQVKEIGAEPMPMTPATFGGFLAEETEKWAKVIKFAGAKAEE